MRSDGFDHMDIATDIHHDPKFRALHRDHPELVPLAFAVYVVTLAESWRGAERMTVEEAWPLLIPFDRHAVDALREARLVDAEGRIPMKTWEAWFGTATDRRRRGRETQRRYDAKRGRTKSSPPAPPSTSVSQSDRPSGRQAGPTPVRHRTDMGLANGRDMRTCPTCGDGPLDDKHDPNVYVIDPGGQLGHRECPTLEVTA